MTTPEKATRPGTAAKYGTLNDLKKAVEDYPEVNWRSFLFWAIGNRDLTSRVEIINWMLDHGADAAQTTHDGNLNALHMLFSESKHDYSMEAKVLLRLLEGGADINLKAQKWGVPLLMLNNNLNIKDNDLGPFYDVIFSWPGIDWEARAGKAFGKPVTLRQVVDLAENRRPEMFRRMHKYLEHGPSQRPDLL